MTTTARPDWQVCRVVDSRLVADRVRRITVERPAPLDRPAAPGSHLDVRVRQDGGTTDVRSYSVVESDGTGRRLTLTVLLAAHSRGGSAFMHGLRPGDTLETTRPLQDFSFAPGADRYVLLAGGIGITALVAMARSLARLQADYRIVYVGRSRTVMAYTDLLVAEHGERLTLHVDEDGTALDVEALVETLDRATDVAEAQPDPVGRGRGIRCRSRTVGVAPAGEVVDHDRHQQQEHGVDVHREHREQQSLVMHDR